LARFETEPFAVRARNSGVSPIFFDPNALLETDPDLERWCIWGARLRRSRMTKLHAPPSQRSRDEPVSQADCPEAEPLADAKAAGMGEATPHTGMAGPALLHAIRLRLLAFGQHCCGLRYWHACGVHAHAAKIAHEPGGRGAVA
jgi:hypothetical protein